MRGVFRTNRDLNMQDNYNNFLNGSYMRDDDKPNLSLLRRWQESTSKFDSNIIINNLKN